MPRLKTNNTKSFTGSRKLSKRTNKKKPTDTEEMLSILEDISVVNKYPQTNHMGTNIKQQDVDPLMISDGIVANNQGQVTNINKIGDLLGMVPQLNNTQQYGNPVVDFASTVQNVSNPFENNQMAQQLNNQLMQGMPNMQMPNMQMPNMQMPNIQGMQMPNMHGGDIFKTLASLYKPSKLI
jgi:hypothetical protein